MLKLLEYFVFYQKNSAAKTPSAFDFCSKHENKQRRPWSEQSWFLLGCCLTCMVAVRDWFFHLEQGTKTAFRWCQEKHQSQGEVLRALSPVERTALIRRTQRFWHTRAWKAQTHHIMGMCALEPHLTPLPSSEMYEPCVFDRLNNNVLLKRPHENTESCICTWDGKMGAWT